MILNDSGMGEPNKVTKWILAGIVIGGSILMIAQIITTCV